MGSHQDRTPHTGLWIGLVSLFATGVLLCADPWANARDVGSFPEEPTASPWDGAVVKSESSAPVADAGFESADSADATCAEVLQAGPELGAEVVAEPEAVPLAVVAPAPPPPSTANTLPITTLASGKQPSGPRLPLLGVTADLGLSGPFPDLGLLLAVRPTRWFRLHTGAGYNGFAFGVRAGLTFVSPIAFPLSLTCEGGHYFEGDANRLVRWVSNAPEVASLKRLSYDYLNVLGGLELGGHHLSLYLRGGITWMRTTVRDFEQSVRDIAQVEIRAADPRVTYRGPTLKLGATYFF